MYTWREAIVHGLDDFVIVAGLAMNASKNSTTETLAASNASNVSAAMNAEEANMVLETTGVRIVSRMAQTWRMFSVILPWHSERFT